MRRDIRDAQAPLGVGELASAVASIRRLNAVVRRVRPAAAVATTFWASFHRFNRDIPAGIAILAGRIVDALGHQARRTGDRIAAELLRVAADELGASGRDPSHAELFVRFLDGLGLDGRGVVRDTRAVASARRLGEWVARAYRRAPVAFALGVHSASEVTSLEEFRGWKRIFGGRRNAARGGFPSYLRYVAVHATAERDHVRSVHRCVDLLVAVRPGARRAVRAGAREFARRYERMTTDLADRVVE
jgi:hypothetical protein